MRKQNDDEIYQTNNGNYILDIINQTFSNPIKWQEKLTQIPGVVEQGLFLNYVDIVICGRENGEIEVIKK